MTEGKHDFLEDSEGKKSSKRLLGSLCIGVSLVMSFMLFTYILYNPTVNIDNSLHLIELVIGVGSLLLGLGITDKFLKRDANNGT